MIKKIPIKNIYYMLAYAWDTLKQDRKVIAGNEDFEDIHNLLACVYINGVSGLIKRGLNKYYVEHVKPINSIKGKIKITASIKEQSLKNSSVVCEYDEFESNIELNRVIKVTIALFLKYTKLNSEYKKKLSKLLLYFNHFDDIRLSKTFFLKLRFNKNNYHYRLLMNISELLFNGLISSEEGKTIEFSDFIRDAQMSNLFEKFVLKFYKSRLPSNTFKVHAPKIDWDQTSDGDISLLPEMRTDIVVENKLSNHQLIIDTKYYANTLVSSNYSEMEKVRSNHLFQIYAYINNSKYIGSVGGMLLYPTIEKELDLNVVISGKSIEVKTLNLDTNWENIEARLMSLI